LRIDSGWRIQWRWETELNPNFQSLWNEPEFQAMVDIIRSDIDRQYEELQALESTGELPGVQEMRSAVD
jgi:hypothetical protein